MIYLLLIGWLLVRCISVLYRRRKLRHIPTLGYSWPILSYITAFKFVNHGFELVEEGYRKYPNKVWKIRTLDDEEGDGWYIIANGVKKVEDISKAPTDQLNHSVLFQSFLQLDHILGREVVNNTYHLNVIRTHFARSVVAHYEEVYGEMRDTFDGLLHSAGVGREWTVVPLYSSFMEVASRVMAGIAGEFSQLFKSSSQKIIKGRMLHIFPRFMRPLISRFYIRVQDDLQKMAELTEPLLAHRHEQEAIYGTDEWTAKPNTMFDWMVDEARKSGAGESPYEIGLRMYFETIALEGIARVTSLALSELASHPASEYTDDIRDEVLSVLAIEREREDESYERRKGWSRQTISKMHKLDSFVKEVMRVYDIQPLHMGCRVLKDFVFSDGTLIPAGSSVFVNSRGLHSDDEMFSNANKFDGYRYLAQSKLESSNGEDYTGEKGNDQVKKPMDGPRKDLMTMPTIGYYAFGYGKHACPGRFLVKTILAHILENYDFELVSLSENHGKRRYFPDLNAQMRFRTRKV